MLRGCFGPMVRTFLSKIVPASDIGKTQSTIIYILILYCCL